MPFYHLIEPIKETLVLRNTRMHPLGRGTELQQMPDRFKCTEVMLLWLLADAVVRLKWLREGNSRQMPD